MWPRRACETAAARWQARLPKLRTTLTGFDPDLDRLWLAAIATASMMLAAAIMQDADADQVAGERDCSPRCWR
ncbi:MAG TPA: hypothetical protein VGO16_08505 [Pseudonocardiaceae bacterium]|jgi:hypothetical protein|nr:hypothetical protein [Pseudonocardiaceae bacterium]